MEKNNSVDNHNDNMSNISDKSDVEVNVIQSNTELLNIEEWVKNYVETGDSQFRQKYFSKQLIKTNKDNVEKNNNKDSDEEIAENMKAVPEKNGNKTVEIDSRKLSTDDSNVSTPGDKINGISRSMTDPEELKNFIAPDINRGMTINVIDQSKIIEEVFKKPNDQVRNNYLKTLQSRKILTDKPAVKEQNIIIFDWDDTQLCTTFLGRLNGIVEQKYREKEKMILNRIDETASALLIRACEYGEPFIITNAARGWVEYSSKLFMPTVHQVLIDKQIKILSARSAYETKYPGDAKRWKMEAFQEIAKAYDKNIITNIIALGDSPIEMEAAKELARNFALNFIKTIKFEESPSPAELIKQQQLVTEKFQQIFLCVKSKMIRLEKKKN